MKKKFSREVKIGIFGLVMILLLYLGVNFIKSNRLFSSDKTFYAVFNSADGLEASAPVMTKGFRIGTVEKVTFDLVTQDIIVTLSVQKEYPVPVDSKAKITSSSILGGKVIELQFGHDAGKFVSKDTIPTVFEPGLMQMVGAEYSSIKDKLSNFATKLDSALDGLNGVVSPQNVKNLEGTLANINSLTANLDKVITKQSGNISKIVDNLAVLSTSLRESAPKLGSAIGKFDGVMDSIPPVIANVADATQALASVLAKIDNGEGNLGKLVNETELYDRLSATITSLEALIVDIKANPKRYINVTIFGKKEKAPKKG